MDGRQAALLIPIPPTDSIGDMPATGPRTRRVSTYEIADIAAQSAPSAAEAQAAIQAARKTYGLTLGEIAAMIVTPVGTVRAWSCGDKRPCATARQFLVLTLASYDAERKRQAKRERQYLRRVAKLKAKQTTDAPTYQPDSQTTDETS